MTLVSIIQATEDLHAGKVIAYPTEAVWGLGCDPFNESAFQQLLALKKRPIEKGVILLASEIAQVEHLFKSLNSNIQQKIISSWYKQNPHAKATTWLLPSDSTVPKWITGKHHSVAVRVTNHLLCQSLCESFGGFIVSTSANPAGALPAKCLKSAKQYFNDQITYLDGSLGLSPEPSRIIDASTGLIIRE
ncbi:L-threonylcarbamoyladenylate synthase [Acinetobacter boissieri]|uniref:Threonylcarbamoyl-AMP synthase n=1 Tax=Acinetobacter boissieri TaxID=1219383 RepID=A0A1G6JE90_9GAMM|nr:Sua5/YciO/YrdC/YwlC family protein [Acinetobacter boissieri]SDC17142.1 L-threonylcarbamoyladenylate synthase [Acinetobacter boissieri]